ncbi:MAG: FecR domain-containing protein [Bdellovibrio sp.]
MSIRRIGFLALFLFPLQGFANVEGMFMVVKGDVQVKAAKASQTVKAKVGQKVGPGDQINTGVDSRAKIVMADKNVLNISPESKIVIENYTNNAKTGEKKVDLKVLEGKLRASVEQKYDDQKNTFQIRTPTAVAGVRGTDFITGFNVQTQVTSIVTFSGVVAVGTPGPRGGIANPVMVQPGQTTSIESGKAPEAPKAIPTKELQKMNTNSQAELRSENENRAPASNTAGGNPSNSNASNSGATPENSPAGPSAPAGGPSAPPSMVTNQDLGPGLAKETRFPAGPQIGPNFNPAAVNNLNPVPRNPFVEGASQNARTKAIIEVRPQ